MISSRRGLRWTSGDAEATGTEAGRESCRLELQGERLALPAGARNVDVTDVELLRALGWDRYRRLVEPPAATIDERSATLLPGLARELRRRGYRLRAERWLQVCVL